MSDQIKMLATVHEKAFSLLSKEAAPLHRLLVQAEGLAKAAEIVEASIGWSTFKRRRHMLCILRDQ